MSNKTVKHEPKVEHAQYFSDGTCRMKQFSNGVTEWYGSEGNVIMRTDCSEPVKQEPVAYCCGFENTHPDGWIDCKIFRDGEFTTPLYAAPVDAKAIRAEALEKAAKACRTAQAKGLQSIREAIEEAIRGLK